MTVLNQPFLSVESLDKTFLLHGQGGLAIEVMHDLSLTLARGECLVLAGRSGIGKSTLLKMLHGSYRVSGGSLRLHFDGDQESDGELELAALPAHAWHALRRDVIGYVSQFLRVVPRVPAVEVVMEPLLARGADHHEARVRAEALLARLNLPERLWSLPPGTFSGGEQQRVNIARGFIGEHPLLLLDEPTASLDAANREVVVQLIQEAKARGTAMLGIFHDEDVRDRVADRLLPLDAHMGKQTATAEPTLPGGSRMTAASEQILTNARLVLEDEVVSGTLVIRDGRIAAIDTAPSQLAGGIDCQGDYLLPGLIELHTDNMEKYFQPRPKVSWPGRQAALAHDAQMASSGITTVFDALSIGDIDEQSMRHGALADMVASLAGIVEDGLARIDHRLHLRCEVSHPETLARFRALADSPLLGLVSLMDHAPGQRQFASFGAYRIYYQGKYRLSDEGLETFIEKQLANSERYSSHNRHAIADECRTRGLALASHDDATIEHVAESLEYGTRVAEFPTSREAAEASHRHAMAVMMGAPNVVRGGSHSGNIAAAELVRLGVLDILSSDYYPAALLDALFRVAGMDEGYALPRAVATATCNPAAAVGLEDRGRLAEGLRADLLRVRLVDDHPLIQRVWCAGRQVH